MYKFTKRQLLWGEGGGGEDRVYPGVLISCQISHPGDPGQNGGDRMMYFL